MNELSEFEGRPVLSSGVEIRNAAGGLNESLGVEPGEWQHDDEITVVMRCKVDKVRFDEVKDTDGLRRVHVLSARTATVIDAEIVDEQLDDQERRIEEAKGVQRLGFGAGEAELAHFRGEHAAELAEGCPSCDAERAAEDEEEVSA